MSRYDQCDATCTTDCGHCKGEGPPVVTAPSSRTGATDREVEPCEDCRWELDGEPCSYHADAATREAEEDEPEPLLLKMPPGWQDRDPAHVAEDLHAQWHDEPGNLMGKDDCGWQCEVWYPLLHMLLAARAALLAEQPGGGRPVALESGRCEICGYEVVRLGSTRWQHARSDLDTHQAVPR